MSARRGVGEVVYLAAAVPGRGAVDSRRAAGDLLRDLGQGDDQGEDARRPEAGEASGEGSAGSAAAAAVIAEAVRNRGPSRRGAAPYVARCVCVIVLAVSGEPTPGREGKLAGAALADLRAKILRGRLRGIGGLTVATGPTPDEAHRLAVALAFGREDAGLQDGEYLIDPREGPGRGREEVAEDAGI